MRRTGHATEAELQSTPRLRERLAMLLLQRCFMVVSASDQASAYRIEQPYTGLGEEARAATAKRRSR